MTVAFDDSISRRALPDRGWGRLHSNHVLFLTMWMWGHFNHVDVGAISRCAWRTDRQLVCSLRGMILPPGELCPTATGGVCTLIIMMGGLDGSDAVHTVLPWEAFGGRVPSGGSEMH